MHPFLAEPENNILVKLYVKLMRSYKNKQYAHMDKRETN